MVFDAAHRYDLFIGAVGFETRSTHVAAAVSAPARYLFPYANEATPTFRRNMELAESLKGSRLVPTTTLQDFQRQVRTVLSHAGSGSRVAVDISSFDRRRLALLLSILHERGQQLHELEVDLLYAPAVYSPPAANLTGSPLEAGPVGHSFHGHLRRTSLPLVAIFGLGYEPLRAIGAFELLEPSKAWAFRPRSGDARYSSSLDEANRLLLSIFEPRDVLSYPVLDPGETFYRLESLVAGLSASNRVVLVPMGPKIFAVCCMLLGLDRAVERPAVWRIGVAGQSVAVDVTPNGEIVGLRLDFASNQED